MRTRTPTVLLEQLVMLLVLALTAAQCLRVLAEADAVSRQAQLQGEAAVLCQSLAEVIRHGGGRPEQALERAAELLGAEYDGERLRLEDSETGLRTEALPGPARIPGLCTATVQAFLPEDGAALFRLEIAWQEVGGDG